MATNVLSYIPRESPVHRLSGAAKLIVFLAWTIVCMLTYNTWVLAAALILGILIFAIAKIRISEVRFVLITMLIFLALNAIAIYIFSPEEGVKVYGTRHILFQFSERYTMTREMLFYLINVILKYFTVVPIALLFITTTDPSEFAASLNKIGISYKIAYAVAITLRYLSDVQSDYVEISQAQQARGIDLSKKAPLRKRIAGLAGIAVPLIFSSLDHIDLVSNAMDLRGFGKGKSRTWYSARPFRKSDRIVVIVTILLSAAALYFTFRSGSRFYNPFL